MKLFWSSRSPYVRKVMIAAHEIGLASRLELVPAVVVASQLNPAVMAVNPLNKIPTLVTDDGTVLFDSLAICEFLDGLQDGAHLFPAAPGARVTALRRHALGNGMLDVLLPWRSELLRPAPQRSPELLAAFAQKTDATLTLLEREADSLAAAPVAIGHVALGAALGYLDFRFADRPWREGRPRLTSWYASFAERPSMRATLPHD
jgi:glutathione S-transferase